MPQAVLSYSENSGVKEAGLLGAQGDGSCRSGLGCGELVLHGARTAEESESRLWVGRRVEQGVGTQG